MRFGRDVVVSPDGVVHVADLADRVLALQPDGSWDRVVGCGERGFSGDGGPASDARLRAPRGIAFGADGALYVADAANHRVRVVRDGVIDTFAGSGPVGLPEGEFAGDGEHRLEARFAEPSGLAVLDDGTVIVADAANHRVRRIDPDGVVSTIAGTGERSFSGDGGPAVEATLSFPTDVRAGLDGELYVVDRANHRIRVISPDGMIDTLAGGGSDAEQGFRGDGGPAELALLLSPAALAITPDGEVLIADGANRRVREVDADGVISTVAGSGPTQAEVLRRDLTVTPGTGEHALEAVFATASGVAVDDDGTMWVITGECQLRRVDPDRRVWAVPIC